MSSLSDAYTKLPDGRTVGQALCDALDLGTEGIQSITIECEAGDLVSATVKKFVDVKSAERVVQVLHFLQPIVVSTEELQEDE